MLRSERSSHRLLSQIYASRASFSTPAGGNRIDTASRAQTDYSFDDPGVQPVRRCFAPKGWWNPPAIKERLLERDIFPVHGRDARYIAIESNPRTRQMYSRYEIPCFWVTKEGTCLTEGTRIVKRLPR